MSAKETLWKASTHHVFLLTFISKCLYKNLLKTTPPPPNHPKEKWKHAIWNQANVSLNAVRNAKLSQISISRRHQNLSFNSHETARRLSYRLSKHLGVYLLKAFYIFLMNRKDWNPPTRLPTSFFFQKTDTRLIFDRDKKFFFHYFTLHRRTCLIIARQQ